MTMIEDNQTEAAPKPAKKNAKPKQEVVVHHEPAASPNPVSIVERAIERGITGADLKEIMDLQERYEANQARKAFDIAMANAQADMPAIIKNKHVYFEPKSGGRPTDYWHEDHAAVVEAIKPVLHKHGLGHRHTIKQSVVNGSMLITVTCIIYGHGWREEVELSSGPDDNSSSMNAIQRIKSATTYLKRTTLETALGLAAKEDDDGRGTEGSPTTITALQLRELEDLAKEVGADVPAACKHLKIESLAELPIAKFDRVKQLLEAKRTPL